MHWEPMRNHKKLLLNVWPCSPKYLPSDQLTSLMKRRCDHMTGRRGGRTMEMKGGVLRRTSRTPLFALMAERLFDFHRARGITSVLRGILQTGHVGVAYLIIFVRSSLKTLTSLSKESKLCFLGDNSTWSFQSFSSLSDCSIWRS